MGAKNAVISRDYSVFPFLITSAENQRKNLILLQFKAFLFDGEGGICLHFSLLKKIMCGPVFELVHAKPHRVFADLSSNPSCERASRHKNSAARLLCGTILAEKEGFEPCCYSALALDFPLVSLFHVPSRVPFCASSCSR